MESSTEIYCQVTVLILNFMRNIYILLTIFQKIYKYFSIDKELSELNDETDNVGRYTSNEIECVGIGKKQLNFYK